MSVTVARVGPSSRQCQWQWQWQWPETDCSNANGRQWRCSRGKLWRAEKKTHSPLWWTLVFCAAPRKKFLKVRIGFERGNVYHYVYARNVVVTSKFSHFGCFWILFLTGVLLIFVYTDMKLLDLLNLNLLDNISVLFRSNAGRIHHENWVWSLGVMGDNRRRYRKYAHQSVTVSAQSVESDKVCLH